MAKVIFQSTNSRVFRATLVGYLYEIAHRHQVVLLTEKIDSDTQRILQERNVFPGLEKIIFFESPFYGGIFLKNYRLRKILREVVREYRPDVVVAPSDMWPAEMYLMRFAKKAGATTVAMQSGFKMAEGRKQYLWSCVMNAHLKMPSVLPLSARLLLAKIKKYAGYVLYHWVLPLSAGETPFFGKTSFVFWDESSGKRDADYAAVFSKRDYDLCVKDGVKPEKLVVIGYPLEHEATRRFFEETYFSQNQGKSARSQERKTLTIMWPEEKFGLREEDYSLISEEQMQESRRNIVQIISEKLPDWAIYIKLKPDVGTEEVSETQRLYGRVSSNISVVAEPADTYIEMSDVICGMSLPSTTLFSAQKQHPGKPILHINLHKELLGDAYKDFEGIEYIDSEEKLIQVLDMIRNNAYDKKGSAVQKFDFADASELIDYLYAKRIS